MVEREAVAASVIARSAARRDFGVNDSQGRNLIQADQYLNVRSRSTVWGRALETRLKTEIIVRGRRGVELTEAGKILLRHGSSVLDTLMLAEAELAAAAGRRASNIRVTAFPSAAATIVATAMAQMAQENPNASFTLIEAEPPDALELLERGECDIAVVFRYSTDASETNEALRWIPLLEEGVHVAIPGNHPSIDEDEIDLTTLRDSPWIAGCPDCRGHLTQACKEAGFVPEIAFETHDYVALQNLAARGLGVALLPDLVLDAVQVDGLRIKPLQRPSTRTVSAVSTHGLSRLPGVHKTLNFLQDAAEQVSMRYS